MFCRKVFEFAGAKMNHIERHHRNLLQTYMDSIGADKDKDAESDENLEDAESDKDHEDSESNENPDQAEDCPMEECSFPVDYVGVNTYEVDRSSTEESEELPTTTIFPNAGIPILEDPEEDPEESQRHRRAVNPWSPFENEREFRLAEWFIVHKISKTGIDDYFKQGLGKPGHREFRSSYTLRKKLDRLLSLPRWQGADAIFNNGDKATFYYRDPIKCMEYLLSQQLYKKDLHYAPVKEYNSGGERLYGEMWTGDWWWETQVL
jgi:hypothetical protein